MIYFGQSNQLTWWWTTQSIDSKNIWTTTSLLKSNKRIQSMRSASKKDCHLFQPTLSQCKSQTFSRICQTMIPSIRQSKSNRCSSSKELSSRMLSSGIKSSIFTRSSCMSNKNYRRCMNVVMRSKRKRPDYVIAVLDSCPLGSHSNSPFLVTRFSLCRGWDGIWLSQWLIRWLRAVRSWVWSTCIGIGTRELNIRISMIIGRFGDRDNGCKHTSSTWIVWNS